MPLGVGLGTKTPEFPIPGHTVRIKFVTDDPTSTYLRVWATDAPAGSALKKRLDDSASTQIEVFEGDLSTEAEKSEPFDFLPDKAGRYVFTAQEYHRASAKFGGGYADDPDGLPLDTLISKTTGIAIAVGDRIEFKLGVQADTATLVLYCWNSTIHATTFEQYGEKTPAIINPSSPKAATAAGDSSVLSLVDALAELTASNVLQSPQDASAAVTNMITKMNAHFALGPTEHAVADTDNTIAASFKNPSSPAALQKSIAECIRKLDQHMRNDKGQGTGSAATAYHTASADWTNALIAAAPGDVGSAMIAIADVWRAYEAHRVNTAVHGVADNTNSLTALPALLNVHRVFLDVLRKSSPTAPTTANSGTTLLVHSAGGKVT